MLNFYRLLKANSGGITRNRKVTNLLKSKGLFILIIFLYTSIGQYSFGQSTRYFERKYYTPALNFEEGRTVQVLPDGYVIGNPFLTAPGNSDIQFRKVDLYGDPVWVQTIVDTSTNQAILCSQFENNNIIFGGYDQNLTTSLSRIKVIKSDTAGNIIWNKSIGDSLRSNFARCINSTWDQGFIIGGRILDTVSNYFQFYFIKTDSIGNVEWTREFNRPFHNEVFSVNQKSDKSFFAVGVTNLILGSGKIWFIKLDSLGYLQEDTSFYDPSYFTTIGYDVINTRDDGFIIIGSTGSGGIAQRGLIMKVDVNGNQIWYNLLTEFPNGFGSPFISELYQIKELNDSSIVVSGFLELQTGISAGQYHIRALLMKFDKYGNELWRRLYPVSLFKNTIGMDLQLTPDGGFVISGYADSISNKDIYLLKTNCLGFIGPPEANFTSLTSGTSVTFTNTSINADTCVYYFGDGDSLIITHIDSIPVTHVYPSQGWYQAYMIAYACGEADTVQIPLYSGISDELVFGNVKMHPNPTSDWLEITYQFNGNWQDGKLVIRDMVGHAVETISIHDQSGRFIVDTNKLSAGTYFVTLQCNGKSSTAQKLVVIR